MKRRRRQQTTRHDLDSSLLHRLWIEILNSFISLDIPVHLYSINMCICNLNLLKPHNSSLPNTKFDHNLPPTTTNRSAPSWLQIYTNIIRSIIITVTGRENTSTIYILKVWCIGWDKKKKSVLHMKTENNKHTEKIKGEWNT